MRTLASYQPFADANRRTREYACAGVALTFNRMGSILAIGPVNGNQILRTPRYKSGATTHSLTHQHGCTFRDTVFDEPKRRTRAATDCSTATREDSCLSFLLDK